MCFLMQTFRKKWIFFSKMPFDCGCNGLKNICFMSSSSATFWKSSFLNSFPMSIARDSEPPKVAQMCFKDTWTTVSADFVGKRIVIKWLVCINSLWNLVGERTLLGYTSLSQMVC